MGAVICFTSVSLEQRVCLSSLESVRDLTDAQLPNRHSSPALRKRWALRKDLTLLRMLPTFSSEQRTHQNTNLWRESETT